VSKTRRAALAIALAVFAALTAPFVSTGVASAAQSDCPAGYLCAWPDASYSGLPITWNVNDSSWSGRLVSACQGQISQDNGTSNPGNMNDCASSIYVKYVHRVVFYQNVGQTGNTRIMNYGDAFAHLSSTFYDSNGSLSLENNISGHCFC
jgi:hypothetical protein